MDGLKTMLLAAATALLNGLVAFGIELTDEQKVAVMGIVGTIVVPVVLLIVRYNTKSPMAGFADSQRRAGIL